MPLYLFEIPIVGRSEAVVAGAVAVAGEGLAAAGGSLIEAQATADRRRLYLVAETAGEKEAAAPLAKAGLSPVLRKQVRLIGQDLETVKARRRPVNFLVEWDLPAGLTMEKYLQRKAEKTPLYGKVPEVSFERTYVCEDMAKCLCFYDGPDEAAVRRAREAVGAPVDRLAPIASVSSRQAGHAAAVAADVAGRAEKG